MPWASGAGLTPDPRSPISKHVSCRWRDWLGGSSYQIESALISYLVRTRKREMSSGGPHLCAPVYGWVRGEGSRGPQLVKSLSSGWWLAPSSPDIHNKALPHWPYSRGHSCLHCARTGTEYITTTPTARTATTTTGTTTLLLLLLLLLTY